MLKVTPQQRANALDALETMWPSVPPENVYPGLEWWRKTSGPVDCGTVGCFGFWCAIWPAFVAQGVQAVSHGAPVPHSFADRFLFGDGSLFTPRDYHPADKGFTGTDHELVTNRLRWLIDNSEVV